MRARDAPDISCSGLGSVCSLAPHRSQGRRQMQMQAGQVQCAREPLLGGRGRHFAMSKWSWTHAAAASARSPCPPPPPLPRASCWPCRPGGEGFYRSWSSARGLRDQYSPSSAPEDLGRACTLSRRCHLLEPPTFQLHPHHGRRRPWCESVSASSRRPTWCAPRGPPRRKAVGEMAAGRWTCALIRGNEPTGLPGAWGHVGASGGNGHLAPGCAGACPPPALVPSWLRTASAAAR